MKKKFLLAAAILIFAAALYGCGKDETEEESVSVSEVSDEISEYEEEVVEEVDPHEGMARSYLTGEWVDEEITTLRPVAVMIGNTEVATPQYGIGDAQVIYEAVVEGALTRLMAIYEDYTSVGKIMSIRSCRRYYIDWALEFDAIYAHYGQATYAKSTLESDIVDNLNGMSGVLANVMYFRDSSKSAPHNAYATGESIAAGIETLGYDTQYSEDYEGHYIFNEDDENPVVLTDGMDADLVLPGYKINKPWFEYNENDGLYYRYQYEEEQIDAESGEQLTVTNIIIQITDWYTQPDGSYLEMYTTAGGDGYYITGGKAIAITWEKESQTAVTHYYDEDGNEITLNQGKTWVCITQDTYADDIQISGYDTEEEDYEQ